VPTEQPFAYFAASPHPPALSALAPHAATMSRRAAAQSLGDRVGDVVFKAITGTLVATTAVAGAWFVATTVSAFVFYDDLERKKKVAQAEAERLEVERRGGRRS